VKNTNSSFGKNVFQWTTNPLLQTLCFLVLGKVSFDFWKIEISFSFGFLVVSLLTSCLLLWNSWLINSLRFKIRIARQFSFWVFFFFIGICCSNFQHRNLEPISNIGFLCKIDESYGDAGNGKIRCVATVEKIHQNDVWKPLQGKVLLQFSDARNRSFQNGDQILIGKELVEIEKPTIPGQFNAKEYYRRKGIDFQVFVSKNDFEIGATAKPNPIILFSHQMRFWLENKINLLSINQNDGYMLSALLLGIRRKIDPELKAAYSSAGVTHILAVSGMHVGLIFGFLSLILGWLKRLQFGHILFSITVIAMLWLYAMVTGLSPSVLRAVTVFSIIQFGDVLKKPGLPINGLSFATILLFIFDVEIIYDVGYQLSFAAVYGIISFERPIRDLIRTKNIVTTFLWKSCAITVAATLATFPLILYYFHQFPVYFLLANLVAVPISNCLIYCGIALIIASPFQLLAQLVAKLIHALLFLLNEFVIWISKLPFSTIEQIYIPGSLLFLLLGFLIFLQLWILRSRYKMLFYSLIFLFLYYLGLSSYQIFLWKRPVQTFAIRTKKEWMISTIQGRKASITLLGSDTLKEQSSFEIKSLKEGFHLLEVASFCRPGAIFSQNKKAPEKRSMLVMEKGKSYLLLGNFLKMDSTTKKKLDIDCLIVQQAGFKTIENALAGINPKEIWVDWPPGSVKRWELKHSEYKILNFKSIRFQPLEI